jgi:hypothetical protein
METYIDNNILARELARERTMIKREPIVLEDPGVMVRSFMSSVGSLISTVNRLFETPLEQATFCSYNPGECRGVA